MDGGSRRRPSGAPAWRHGLAFMLLVAVIGGAGERPRGDGAGAAATATAPRPSRVAAEWTAHCRPVWLTGGSVDWSPIIEALMAAPLCAAIRALGCTAPGSLDRRET